VNRPRGVVIRPLAREDITEAAIWYELRAEGLGVSFRSIVEETLAAIAEAPERFRVVHRDIRRGILADFPYALYYVVRENTVEILACMHGRRRPRRWQSRRGDS
jgi:plasmid stabilization system protein ParE